MRNTCKNPSSNASIPNFIPKLSKKPKIIDDTPSAMNSPVIENFLPLYILIYRIWI